jgi:hypothetical protein
MSAIWSYFQVALLKLARSIAGAIWLASIGAAIIVLVGQSVFWLKTAIWPTWTIADAIDLVSTRRPSLSWKGFQEIIDWSLRCPLSIGALLLGAIGGNAIWRLALLMLGRRHASS